MEKRCGVLWLRIIGLFTSRRASVLASKLLIASDCTAEEGHLRKHGTGKLSCSQASSFPLCLQASLQQP